MGVPICPKCNKPTRRMQGASSTTLLHVPVIYDKNGKGIARSPVNTTTTWWKCLDCGTEWSVKE